MVELIRAAGLLIYKRQQNVTLYLLLQASYEPFHWTPPKGNQINVLVYKQSVPF